MIPYLWDALSKLSCQVSQPYMHGLLTLSVAEPGVQVISIAVLGSQNGTGGFFPLGLTGPINGTISSIGAVDTVPTLTAAAPAPASAPGSGSTVTPSTSPTPSPAVSRSPGPTPAPSSASAAMASATVNTGCVAFELVRPFPATVLTFACLIRPICLTSPTFIARALPRELASSPYLPHAPN